MDITLSELFDQFHEIINYSLFTIKQTEVTVMSIIVFFGFLIFFTIAGKVLSRLLFNKVLKKVSMDEGIRFTLTRITNYTIVLIGIVIAFQFLGIDLSGLAVIFGLLSVGIGFGLQNLTSNFISGLILLFERPISIGDRVIINDLEGDVIEINMRSTTISSVNNISIIVPNSDFISGQVVNYSHGDPKIRIEISVGVSYDSDLDLVLSSLLEVGAQNQEVMKTPAPEVMFIGFGDSSWDLILRCWITNPKRHPYVRSELNIAIVRKFREKGIEIPYPQRDLHLRSPLPVPHTSGKVA
ncbi:MAG: mechanosensitive ion channel family protein [Balneolaceae bacterium]|nr:MAG: mechanosensitive ion channel family protein [Balneolaceae bacterium]